MCVKKTLKSYSARLNSPTPRINLILQRRNSELTKKFGARSFVGCVAVANQLAAA